MILDQGLMSHKTLRETLQFLSIARGSAAELETQVPIGQEIGYINQELAENWVESIERIQKLLSGHP